MLELGEDSKGDSPDPLPFIIYPDTPHPEIVKQICSTQFRAKLGRCVGAGPGQAALAAHIFTATVDAGESQAMSLAPTKPPPTPGSRTSLYDLRSYTNIIVFAVCVGAVTCRRGAGGPLNQAFCVLLPSIILPAVLILVLFNASFVKVNSRN